MPIPKGGIARKRAVDQPEKEEEIMLQRIVSLALAGTILASTFGLLATLQGCVNTKRAEVRQEERVEQRTQDRYERRRGDD